MENLTERIECGMGADTANRDDGYSEERDGRESDERTGRFFRDHERRFADFRYIYPVISRRAGGLSVGVNLTPGAECPFRCVYCQVDRAALKTRGNPWAGGSPLEMVVTNGVVDVDRLESELTWLAERIVSGEFWRTPPFDAVPSPLRRWNDIALSGDGEPTLSPVFSETMRRMTAVRERFAGECVDAGGVTLVLITSSACLDLPSAQDGLERLRALRRTGAGAIWAKLDAGTDLYYRRINRSGISFERIVRNLTTEASHGPLVIQTLLVDGHAADGAPLRMDDSEINAYIARLADLATTGGIDHIQIHTVARRTDGLGVTMVTSEFADQVADRVRRETRLRVIVYH